MRNFSNKFAIIAIALPLAGCVPPAANIETPAPVAPAEPAAPEPQAAPASPSGATVPGIYTSSDGRWIKDQYGRCYSINSQGDRVYDASKTC